MPDEVDKQTEVAGEDPAETKEVVEEKSQVDSEAESDEAAGSSSFKQQLLGR